VSTQNKYPDDWDYRRRSVYQRDGYECQECGAEGGPKGDNELHAHHRTPISEGGGHELDNLETLCKSCHNDQHDHDIGVDSTSGIESTLETLSALKPWVEPLIAYPIWILFIWIYMGALADVDQLTVVVGVALLVPLTEGLYVAFGRGLKYGSVLMVVLYIAGGYAIYTDSLPVETAGLSPIGIVAALAPATTGLLGGVTGGAIVLVSLHLPLLWVALRD
jgi:hypothetical protein